MPIIMRPKGAIHCSSTVRPSAGFDCRQQPAIHDRLVALVSERREPMTVRAVARETGIGLRRVQQLFRNDVGLSPKQLHRITRFQRALALGRGQPRQTWSAIASRAGYFDQAHLIHESRDIAGRTPAELLGDKRPHELTDAFLGRERKRR